jgi:hypothetical protein
VPISIHVFDISPIPLQARQELRELSGADEGRKLDDILGSVGLAGVADQLKDLRLGECVVGGWVESGAGEGCGRLHYLCGYFARPCRVFRLLKRFPSVLPEPLSDCACPRVLACRPSPPALPCPAGELLDTPPPGIDEAIAIAKVIQFLKVSAGPAAHAVHAVPVRLRLFC